MPFLSVHDQFYPKAKTLRSHFDRLYRDPRKFEPGRFVWDLWHVPGHYHHLKTPAYHFFPEKIYADFHRGLVEWGRENLGCHDVSPTWLSLYPEGSYQHQHVDEPHGPLAFVYSLTLNPRSFKGGRTLISKERSNQSGREWNQPVEKMKHKISVEPKFNRLIIFDPSYPHGVSQVKGVEDPRSMRLVIHGWFVQPRAFWYGPLSASEVQRGFDGWLAQSSVRNALGLSKGYLALKVSVQSSGKVEKMEVIASTMSQPQKVFKDLKTEVENLNFPKKNKLTKITFPIVVH